MNKLKRSESFFGVHFDFHAKETTEDIGLRTTEEMVEEIIISIRPDYVQCDCKGHLGYSSYPTKVGIAAPGLKKDALRIWREVTQKHGVSLYMHYSGVWDTQAIKKNPQWARIDEKGEIDKNNTSVYGSYVNELLIPQLKELCDEYQVDGAWIDGDCWAVEWDYAQKTVEQFKQEAGITEIPLKPEDPYYQEFTQFFREGFKRYLRHYVDELHKHNPDFEVASNWAFSSFMPEPVSANVDFLSGDYPSVDSLNVARMEARCLARQGKPWDLMAWGFRRIEADPCESTKPAVQLCQEAAIVLSLGGGFQTYLKQKKDGSVATWQMKHMGEVAKFCRDRQEYCHKAEAVPQIAFLYAKDAYYRKIKKVFGAWSGELIPVQGALQALLDSQNAVEVLMDHQLLGRMHEYPLIVIPEWEYIEPSLKEELTAYVHSGGNLIIIGPKTAEAFQEELSIEFTGDIEEDKNQWIEANNWLGAMRTVSRPVVMKSRAVEFGKLYDENDINNPIGTAASIATLGKGRIAATYFNFGERYINGTTSVARDFLSGLVKEMFPDPIVEVKGSHFVDLTVNKINGILAMNLVKTVGMHASLKTIAFDEVPAVGPLHIKIRYGQRPEKVIAQPEGSALDFTYEEGIIHTTLSKLEIHNTILINPAL